MAVIAFLFAGVFSLLAAVVGYLLGFGISVSLAIWVCSGLITMLLIVQRYLSMEARQTLRMADEIEADIVALQLNKLSSRGSFSPRH